MALPTTSASIAAQVQATVQRPLPRRMEQADLTDLAAKPQAAPLANPEPRVETRPTRPGSLLDIKV